MRRQLAQWKVLAELLPRTDLFHFTFGLTLVPQSLQFPILRALRKRSVMQYLGLGHPRQDAGGARLREKGRRGDRRQLRRDPLGSPRDRDPARHRPRPRDARAAVRTAPPRRRPRALVATAQGHRPRRSCLRGARRRAADRRGAPSQGGARAVPRRGHRRRPAERRLVRPLRDRVHGARQAGRHLPPRGGDAPHGGGVRAAGADRERLGRDAPRPAGRARRARPVRIARRSDARRANTPSASTTSSA